MEANPQPNKVDEPAPTDGVGVSSSDRAALAQTELGTGDSGARPDPSADTGEWRSSRPPPVIVHEGEIIAQGPDPMIGRVLSGLYKVQDRIGEGGMGTVYMALHIHLNKPFAVKVLSEKVAANKTAVDRLLQEAQAASSIDHDNIVDVVSFDATDDGRVFLVMEMLKGRSLGDVVDAGPMKLERALPIIYQLCQALGAAHETGIVHRDLKPDNVFIVQKSEADFVKVLDFGISKVKSAEAEQVRMTKTGQLVGTPLYMSPEQAKGESDVDHRADIYALGVMLYEMLCGVPPFEGGNYFQLLWKHGNEDPEPPTKHRDDIPSGVSDAIMRSLRKSPDDRFQSMSEFEAALVGSAPHIGANPSRLVSLPPGAMPSAASPEAPSRTPWFVAAALALVCAGLVGVFLAQPREPPLETPPELAQEATPETEPAIVPDPPTTPEETPLPEGADVPPTVSVRFLSTPEGAEVTRADDGSVLGTTPFEVPLEVGLELEVHFSRRGYRMSEETFTVSADAPEIDVSLRRNRRTPTPNGSGVMFKMGL